MRMWDARYLAHLHLLLHLKLVVGYVRGSAGWGGMLMWESGRGRKSLHVLVLDRRPEAIRPIHDRHPHRVRVHSEGHAAQDRIHQARHTTVWVVTDGEVPVGGEEVEVAHDLTL